MKGSAVGYDPKNSVYLVVSAYGPVNGRFVSADGALLGGQFPIKTGSVGQYPRVAYSADADGGNGAFLVTWQQSDAINNVFSRLVSYTAGLIGPEEQLSVDGSFNESGAAVAYSTVSKEFMVVWDGMWRDPVTNGLSWKSIVAQRIGAGGNKLGSLILVNRAPAAGWGYRDPSIAYNPDTNEYLTVYTGWNNSFAFVNARRIAPVSATLLPTGDSAGEKQLSVATGTYITEVAYNPTTKQYLASWYQFGTYGLLLDGAGNPVSALLLQATRFTAYDALGLAYNANSGSFMMVSHDALDVKAGGSLEDGATELSGTTGKPIASLLATQSGGRIGNYYPKIAAAAGRSEWLMSTATDFGATMVQRLASGPPPPPPAPTVSLVANQTMPITEGKVIVWTAAASGGAGPYTYQFWRYMSESGWVMDQDWSAVSTYGWAPTAGTRAIQVRVRNSGSTTTYDAFAGTGVFSVIAPSARLASLTSNVSFPSAPNVPITFTAQAMGGVAPLQYQFWLFREGVGWSIVQAYSSYNTYTWYPVEGNYAFQVWVRGTGSTAQYEDWRSSGFFSIVNTPAKLSGLTASRAFPSSPDTSITWTAQASGGNGALDYKFWLFSTVTGWSVLQDWSSSNQLTWTPGVPYAGQHVVQVWVRTHGSAAQYEDYRATDWFTVTNSTALSLATSLSLSNYSVTNGCVLFSASTTGPGVWEYQFWTYSNSTWTVGQTYSSLYNTFNYCPTPGTYAVQVWTRQAGSVTGLWERYASTGYFVVNP